MAANLYVKFFLGLILPTLAAGLAVMSVDFGGEFLKIAIVKPGVPMEIVLNKESQRKTPNIVVLKDGERLFGNAALQSALRYPKSAYRYVHDVLGKDFDNPLVKEFWEKYPYYELEKDPETGAVLFVHDENTKYSPEELVAMILQMAKENAEAFAEQPISEAVITVPAFFNQAERRAMIRAAELAGIKVLQLIGDNAAIALNYGVFRRKTFNSTPLYYMFVDIGATATVASIIEYQVVKTKSASGLVDTYPQLAIRGFAFDRNLGGSKFQRRLRNHLARQFNENRKVKKDVFQDIKAMQKLYKEAGRVKQVLSANIDHFAQVENLSDDEDFRVKVTRDELEHICSDLFGIIERVVRHSVESAELTMADMSEVILMGGGTRMPKIQEILKKTIGREELGKGINTDEAAALGAVYQAAHLGMGFKVQKFNVREAVLFPIQVEFDRVKLPGDSEDAPKLISKTLFGLFQSYPHKKVMTFNKNTKDFDFRINYDRKYLSEEELYYIGNLSISVVNLSGVEEAFSKHDASEVPKGIKAHFVMDGSGILRVDKVEAMFEKNEPIVEEDFESTLSKLGKSFSSFFGSQPSEGGEGVGKEGSVESEEATKNSTATPTDEGTLDKNASDGEVKKEGKKKSGDKQEGNKQEEPEEVKEKPAVAEQSAEEIPEEDSKDDGKIDEILRKMEEEEEEAKKETPKTDKKSQVVLLKEPLTMNVDVRDLKNPSLEKLNLSKKHLDDLKKRDEEKVLLDKVKNDIESFVVDTRDKLEQEEYIKCSKSEERDAISEALSATSDWMFEQEDDAPKKVFVDKLDELKRLTWDLFERVLELQQRPFFIETLNARVNQSEHFLHGMANYTGEDQPFTKVEYDALKKLIKEIKVWNKTVHMEQKNTPLTEKPAFTAQDVISKINDLDREIKYLVNKVKSYKPKEKPSENKTEKASKESSAKKKKDKATESTTDEPLFKDELPPVTPEGSKKEEESIKQEDEPTKKEEEPAKQEEETIQLEDKSVKHDEIHKPEETHDKGEL